MSKLSHSNPDSEQPLTTCERCNSFVCQEDLNVEVFELTGQIVCADCAEDVWVKLNESHTNI